MGAGMVVKAEPPALSASNVTITSGVMNDYNFRGVTQSNRQPSVQFGLEPRYNFGKDLQGYFGVSGESIVFPNRAAAEIDLYGGIRPTFDKLATDFGIWYYEYPNGQCFNTVPLCNAFGGGPGSGMLPNGDPIKQNVSFTEFYGKAVYAVNDNFNFGGSIWGAPNLGSAGAGVLNTGAPGVYYAGTAVVTAPTTWLPHGIGAYVSADLGYWQLNFRTADAFYGNAMLPSYLNWDAGLAFTWKIFTLDLRYYQSNMTKAQCNVFTGDQTATGGQSNWCGADLVAKLSIATGLSALK
jgi:hypothetical protein